MILDLARNDPTVVRAEYECDDCGKFVFESQMWSDDLRCHVETATFYFNRGGFGTVSSVLRNCKGCILTGPSGRAAASSE